MDPFDHKSSPATGFQFSSRFSCGCLHQLLDEDYTMAHELVVNIIIRRGYLRYPLLCCLDY
ncbi:hypothetical protein I79_022911 [Cricetulus griseus]|uniref:Uncharacterized protein n=1 Tax=Cricetulus griseus TaxID=10029 RepID=G3IGJ4_CRIGR|nr:hypothetical protein I79_022911 [Cricetulus griseus]